MAGVARRSLRIGLIPGDGIGREVIPCGQRLLQALSSKHNLEITFTHLPAGFDHFKATGTALPPKTVDTLRNECDGALFGAVSSPTTATPGYSSPIVALRKQLDLYANVRPVKSVVSKSASGGDKSREIDMMIVRENTEDLYVKEESTTETPEGLVATATKRISERASQRIATMAGEIALRRSRVRPTDSQRKAEVTITHKSNVLPQTDGLFRRTCLSVLSQPPYHPTVNVAEQIVDSMVYKLFRQPADYDVIVAPNLYGDILSDGAAALVGSLGVVPSANVGDAFAIGEPCHGSAPDIAGKGVANPIATLRSVGVMLEFLGEEGVARDVFGAVDGSLGEGSVLSPDLGGKAGTQEVLEDVLRRL